MISMKDAPTAWVVVWVIVAIGALNWGLVGAFDYNLLTDALGLEPDTADIVYIVIGLLAVLDLAETFGFTEVLQDN